MYIQKLSLILYLSSAHLVPEVADYKILVF